MLYLRHDLDHTHLRYIHQKVCIKELISLDKEASREILARLVVLWQSQAKKA